MGLSVSWATDEAALQALGPAWEALAERAAAAGQSSLYASHGYVRHAWQHLRAPGDRLAVLTLFEGPVLRAVWPLVRRHRRVLGLWPLGVLEPIGIWEGERPGLLCEGDAGAVWPVLWSALCRNHRLWQGLDLRELDAGAGWLAQPLARPAWLRQREVADTEAPWQPFDGHWHDHVAKRPPAVRAAHERSTAALRQRAPDLRIDVASDPVAVAQGLQRYLALDALRERSDAGYLLGRDAARAAFYRAWLPELAARGQAQIWWLQARDGDVAALLRLRCGQTWLERHLTQHPAWRDAAPALHLMVEALAQSWQADAGASDLLVPPGAEVHPSLLGWYDTVRSTRRLRAWNLCSRAVLMPLMEGLRGRG